LRIDWLDRTSKTHPPDPLNKSKFRKKGGGVLIAVRFDLKIEVKSQSKVKLKLSHLNSISERRILYAQLNATE
jgi:hypothetical protein